MANINIVVLDPQDVYFPWQTIQGHMLLDLNDFTNIQRKLSLFLDN